MLAADEAAAVETSWWARAVVQPIHNLNALAVTDCTAQMAALPRRVPPRRRRVVALVAEEAARVRSKTSRAAACASSSPQ